MLLTACRFHVLAGRLQGAGDATAAALRRVLYYSEQLSLDYKPGRDQRALFGHLVLCGGC